MPARLRILGVTRVTARRDVAEVGPNSALLLPRAVTAGVQLLGLPVAGGLRRGHGAVGTTGGGGGLSGQHGEVAGADGRRGSTRQPVTRIRMGA
jgi:hypothetical protein